MCASGQPRNVQRDLKNAYEVKIMPSGELSRMLSLRKSALVPSNLFKIKGLGVMEGFDHVTMSWVPVICQILHFYCLPKKCSIYFTD